MLVAQFEAIAKTCQLQQGGKVSAQHKIYKLRSPCCWCLHGRHGKSWPNWSALTFFILPVIPCKNGTGIFKIKSILQYELNKTLLLLLLLLLLSFGFYFTSQYVTVSFSNQSIIQIKDNKSDQTSGLIWQNNWSMVLAKGSGNEDHRRL